MLQLNSHSLLNCIDKDGSFPHIDKTRIIGSPYNITRTFFAKPNDVIPEQYNEDEICKLLEMKKYTTKEIAKLVNLEGHEPLITQIKLK